MSLLFIFIWSISIFAAESAFGNMPKNIKVNSLINRTVRRASYVNIPKILTKGPHSTPPLLTPADKPKFIIPPVYYPEGFDFYLTDKSRLFKGPIPMHYLNDPEFFDEAVRRGQRSLCQYLLINGQRVKILKENGDNLFVRLIENDMSEFIGILLTQETTKQEALKALDVADAKSGMKPIDAALKNGDRIAIYNIVSPPQ